MKCRRPQLDPWVRRITCIREGLPTPAALPRESQRQRNLTGYSPWGLKVPDITLSYANTFIIPEAQLLSHMVMTFCFFSGLFFGHSLFFVVPYNFQKCFFLLQSSFGRIQGVPSGWMASAREDTWDQPWLGQVCKGGRERQRERVTRLGMCSWAWQNFIFYRGFYILS